MNLHVSTIWEVAAGAVLLGAVAAGAVWLFLRKRPTAMEVEFARRQFLTEIGRLVDGTLLDVTEVPDQDGQPATYLLYEYRIGGVDYECSQEITHMGSTLDSDHIRAGFPCSVRYQPGNPQNSIVVAETWSGLRVKLPLYSAFESRRATEPHTARPTAPTG
ncbi:MAG: hypothetical protein ACLGSD_17070 [Acidobacteriota bacterium]